VCANNLPHNVQKKKKTIPKGTVCLAIIVIDKLHELVCPSKQTIKNLK